MKIGKAEAGTSRKTRVPLLAREQGRVPVEAARRAGHTSCEIDKSKQCKIGRAKYKDSRKTRVPLLAGDKGRCPVEEALLASHAS